MALKFDRLEMATKLPDMPRSLPVFELEAQPLARRRGAIDRLGELLQLGRLRSAELEHGIVMASERGEITHFHASGAMLARDATAAAKRDNEWRHWDGQTESTVDGHRVALNADASRKLLGQARQLLEPLELLGKQVASETVQLDQVAELDAKGKEIRHGAGAATIKFLYAVDGVAVRGAGAKTLVFAEPEHGAERPAGLFHAWRDVGKPVSVKLDAIEQALAVGLLSDPELDKYGRSGHSIRINRLELVYLALPAFIRQSHLFPVFQVEGTVGEGKRGSGFEFGRFHHAVAAKVYAGADLYSPFLSANPDGIKGTEPRRRASTR